jgi:hypothetical protein
VRQVKRPPRVDSKQVRRVRQPTENMKTVRRRMEHPPLRPLNGNKLTGFLDNTKQQPATSRPRGGAAVVHGWDRTCVIFRRSLSDNQSNSHWPQRRAPSSSARHLIDRTWTRLTTAWEENEVASHSGGAGGGGQGRERWWQVKQTGGKSPQNDGNVPDCNFNIFFDVR